MNRAFYIPLIILFLIGCKSQRYLNVEYIKNQNTFSEKIKLDFISKNGHINSPYIDSVKFGYLDSISFPGNNPDKMKSYISYRPLNFKKKINPYSPEYYAAYTIYNIQKVIKYYNGLFDNKIDFNSQKDYKNIEIVFGKTDFLTSPKIFCFIEKSKLAPSLFFHEIGHRAFWYIQDEDGLNIKFGGLTIIHMGLLEYFNMSLNNSPVEAEENPLQPNLLMRNASLMYKYPLDSTYTLRGTLQRLKNASQEDIKNPNSSVSKYLAACYHTYNASILDRVYDNHLGGMVLSGTLWRIRENIGQNKTDQLVAKTILDLNRFMDMRKTYYKEDAAHLSKNIDWSDVFYGMIQKDNELYKGNDIGVIEKEFKKTGYPIEKIKY